MVFENASTNLNTLLYDLGLSQTNQSSCEISVNHHSCYFYSTSSSSLLLPAKHGCCVRASRRSAAGNCEWRTCPWSIRGG